MDKVKTNSSKKNRYAWIAIGVIILLLALLSMIQQGIAKNRAAGMVKALQLVLPESTQISGAELDQMSAEGLPDVETAVINDLPVMGEMLIPAIDVDVALICDYSKDDLKKSPCIISGSAAGRNLIIAGGSYKAQLASLNTLTRGDTVMICDLNGRMFIYDVDSLEFADKEHALEISDAGCDLSLYCVSNNGSARYVARCTLCQ